MNDFNKSVVAASEDEKKSLSTEVLNEKIVLFLKEYPLACPGKIAAHLGISVNTVTKLLRPNGFPSAWTKETVENILNDIVWKNARGVTLRDIKSHKGEPNTPLWKAFIFYEFPASYPLENYRKKFHRMIYPLFGIEIPQSCEEEREIEWPEEKTLHKRYHSLMLLHHSDHHNQSDIIAKVADINSCLIIEAYNKILKRKKWLTINDPPPPPRKYEDKKFYKKKKIN